MKTARCRMIFNHVILALFYVLLSLWVFKKYGSLFLTFKKDLILENVHLDCLPVMENRTAEGQNKYTRWTMHYEHIEEELKNTGNFCETIHKYFMFEQQPLSDEESEFPLAYGFVVYRDFIQVLLQFSIFYQPQNQYCIVIDENAWDIFQSIIQRLPTCFSNVATFIGQPSYWGSYGIVENMMACVDYLSRLQSNWTYYQYLSGSDIPIRTNLEMVRIMKALNGSINTDVEQLENNRLNHLRTINRPVYLYKSSMSVALPRAAANYIIRSKRIVSLFQFISWIGIPDEAVWTTLGGNKKDLGVPGSIDARDILYLRHYRKEMSVSDIHTVDNIGSDFIARYQVWWTQPNCKGGWNSESCVFGVRDIPTILKRPELIAHKFYKWYEPAAMICLIKEIRRRSHNPEPFDAVSYSKMPSVELHNGKNLANITHPEWVRRSSFS